MKERACLKAQAVYRGVHFAFGCSCFVGREVAENRPLVSDRTKFAFLVVGGGGLTASAARRAGEACYAVTLHVALLHHVEAVVRPVGVLRLDRRVPFVRRRALRAM